MIKETIISTSTIYALNIPENWIGKPVTIVYDKEWIETNATEKNDAIELRKNLLKKQKNFTIVRAWILTILNLIEM
ncbi:MAG: hypothetical protein LH615_14385, partial [Ferruginibacter sp.]|nr:hypothetical protein [Ferruginibacter sp.]